ncbi:MAG: Peptidase Imelysin [Myxococcaceae bacterium]|nr:Peptidase Imelysin [Myxococcaceae bacterium]
MRNPLVLASALALLAACSDDAAADVDRNAMLRDLADNVIVPGVQQYAVAAHGLAVAAEGLCASPGLDALEETRAAWRAARIFWKEAQIYQAGPYETLHMQGVVDWSPVLPADVEAVIAGAGPLTADAVDSLGSNRRGLAGVEVVLFDPARDPAAIVAALRDGANPSRRCQYLAAVTAHVDRASQAYLAAWQPTGGGYARTLATAGQGSSIGTTREGVDLLVNQVSNALETLQVSRLSTPAGSRNGGVAQPERVESALSGASVAEVSAGLRGVRALYLGTYLGHSGLGLASMVAARSTSLDRSIRAELDASEASVRAITLPLQRAVTEQRALVDAAVTELGRLKRLVRVDLANTCGVTIAFNSNDGD